MAGDINIGLVLARSPYIITINESGQTQTRIELYIWQESGSEPTFPTYSLSKKIPSENLTRTDFNISPYFREYFNYNSYSGTNGGTQNVLPTEDIYCYFRVKTFYTYGGVETQLDDLIGFSTDGYGYYQDLSNYNYGGIVLLTNLNYEAPANDVPTVFTYPCELDKIDDVGTVTLNTNSDHTYKIKYTELGTGDFYEQTVDVYPLAEVQKTIYYSKGNIWQLYLDDELYVTYIFQPQCECKYQPVMIDFINRFGVCQREWFYKASYESLEVKNNQYKLNPTKFPSYMTYEGQIKTFNTNGKTTLKLNTGWVEEAYKAIIQELMLSELIRVDDKPAILKTKSVDKIKSINTKQINYTMEFELSYDIINSVS